MRYDGPAALVLSPDEAQLVLEALLEGHSVHGEPRANLVARICGYLSNDWERKAAARSRAMASNRG